MFKDYQREKLSTTLKKKPIKLNFRSKNKINFEFSELVEKSTAIPKFGAPEAHCGLIRDAAWNIHNFERPALPCHFSVCICQKFRMNKKAVFISQYVHMYSKVISQKSLVVLTNIEF